MDVSDDCVEENEPLMEQVVLQRKDWWMLEESVDGGNVDLVVGVVNFLSDDSVDFVVGLEWENDFVVGLEWENDDPIVSICC